MVPLTTEAATHELQRLDGLFHLPDGRVPNFLKTLARSPAALEAYIRAEKALESGELTPLRREEIALAVAEINGSNYCVAMHAMAGEKAGLSPEEVQFARRASACEPKSKAMLQFVQAVVLQRGEVSDEEYLAVRKAGFSEAEIIEILANVGLNIFTNYFNIVARTEPDAPAERGAVPVLAAP